MENVSAPSAQPQFHITKIDGRVISTSPRPSINTEGEQDLAAQHDALANMIATVVEAVEQIEANRR